jgi:hypothetical protein
MKPFRTLIAVLLFLAVPSVLLAQHPVTGEVRVSVGSQDVQELPRIATNRTGEFVVTWLISHPEANERSLRAVRFNSDGTPATGELLIEEETLDVPSASAVAMMDDGSFVVVFPKADGAGLDLVARWYKPNGDPDGDDVLVTRAGTGDFAISTQGDGGFVAVWKGSAPSIRARVFKASHAAGSEIAIDSAGDSPVVSVGPQDAFVVAWRNGNLVARRFTPQGDIAGRRIQVAKGNVLLPLHIGKDDGGDFLIFWGGPTATVFGQRYKADTTPIGGLLHLQAGQNFDVAVGGQGNFVLVWEAPDAIGTAGGTNVFTRRFKSDGSPLGPQLRVNVRTPGFQERPQVGIGADGGFVVVWQGETSGNGAGDIFARQYERK